MESFENRERGFEHAFAHDEALRFRARIGGLRKLATWAGLEREASEALIARAFEGADDETLIAGLAGDGLSLHRLRARLAAFAHEAAREIHG